MEFVRMFVGETDTLEDNQLTMNQQDRAEEEAPFKVEGIQWRRAHFMRLS
jgi:hypothetical protein